MIIRGGGGGDTVELWGNSKVGEGLENMWAETGPSMGPIDFLETHDDTLWDEFNGDPMFGHA